MKYFDGLNYYEILKIPEKSSFLEIKQAYKDAVSIYGEDSLVTYSLFSTDERGKILKIIEEAFFTLIDGKKRAAYDRMLVDSGQSDTTFISDQSQSEPVFHPGKAANDDPLAADATKTNQTDEEKQLSDEILSKSSVSGNDLKKLREALGVEIHEIHSLTRISVSVLNAIEENRLESLPPDVYLRNFLKLFAEVLQIDPMKIVDGYFKHISMVKNTD
ncbi:MAG: helix-turn-helix domain-containing protein [Deltaproteobacteria bacterium]|jgi:curved DNA-binding protein CbpA|nr:helix-turn-helix domain-containing protein [Deltaproteobacteria bacterium]